MVTPYRRRSGSTSIEASSPPTAIAVISRPYWTAVRPSGPGLTAYTTSSAVAAAQTTFIAAVKSVSVRTTGCRHRKRNPATTWPAPPPVRPSAGARRSVIAASPTAARTYRAALAPVASASVRAASRPASGGPASWLVTLTVASILAFALERPTGSTTMGTVEVSAVSASVSAAPSSTAAARINGSESAPAR